MSNKPWYVEFFGEEYLQVYGLARTPDRTRMEVDQILQLLNLPVGSKILDLCCGYGRHSIELATRGYNVTGLDLSEHLLNRAKSDAERAEVEVEWVHGDMRDLPFESEFHAVINMFNSFGYFETEEEDQRVLEQVCGVLLPGGGFLQEIPNVASFVRAVESTKVGCLPDEVFVIEERDFDPVSGRMSLQIRRLLPDGRRTLSELDMRLYSPPEMKTMLGKAGLEVRGMYGALDRTALTLDSVFLVILNRKTVSS